MPLCVSKREGSAVRASLTQLVPGSAGTGIGLHGVRLGTVLGVVWDVKARSQNIR